MNFFYICLWHSYSFDTYCIFSNNLWRFIIWFQTGSMNLNTSHRHRIFTKKSPVPLAITKVEYKVCFGYNNLNSNYLQHIGLVKIYDTSKLDLTVRNLPPPKKKERINFILWNITLNNTQKYVYDNLIFYNIFIYNIIYFLYNFLYM